MKHRKNAEQIYQAGTQAQQKKEKSEEAVQNAEQEIQRLQSSAAAVEPDESGDGEVQRRRIEEKIRTLEKKKREQEEKARQAGEEVQQARQRLGQLLQTVQEERRRFHTSGQALERGSSEMSSADLPAAQQHLRHGAAKASEQERKLGETENLIRSCIQKLSGTPEGGSATIANTNMRGSAKTSSPVSTPSNNFSAISDISLKVDGEDGKNESGVNRLLEEILNMSVDHYQKNDLSNQASENRGGPYGGESSMSNSHPSVSYTNRYVQSNRYGTPAWMEYSGIGDLYSSPFWKINY